MNERGAISKRNVTVERDYYRFSFAGFHFRFSLFRASRTNSLFSSRRSLEISRFFYRNPPPPSSSPLEISRQTHLRSKLTAQKLNWKRALTSITRRNDAHWSGVGMIETQSGNRKQIRGVGEGGPCSTPPRIIVRVTDKLTSREGRKREEAMQRHLITELGRPSRSFGHLVSGNEGALFPMHREARGWRAHITLLLRSTWIGTYRDRHS